MMDSFFLFFFHHAVFTLLTGLSLSPVVKAFSKNLIFFKQISPNIFINMDVCTELVLAHV